MRSNFDFLASLFPTLEKIGSLAEQYLHSDTNACLYKLRSFVEVTVNYMFELDDLDLPSDNNLYTKIKKLKKKDLLPSEIYIKMDRVRGTGNKAVHAGYDSLESGKALVETTFYIAVWFMQTYGDYTFEPAEYVIPEDARLEADYQRLLEERETLLEKLQNMKAAALASSQITGVNVNERRQRSGRALFQMRKSEAETRRDIDEQLRQVGWEADSENLTYGKGARPEAGRNMAIAEWPTGSTTGNWGRADYMLFAGKKLVAVIEAKPDYKEVSSVIDNQCKEYSKGIKEEHHEYLVNTWEDYKVPFLFATNGRPYLKQIETKSGIWFRDARVDSNIPRALMGWFGPEDMLDMLKRDIAAANHKLETTPYDLLRDEGGLSLRQYQIEAIQRAEEAIIEGKDRVLLAMATGTGKTRTIAGMMYRFLETERFKRILYLVDRTALGDQTEAVFHDVMIKDLLTLAKIYDVKGMKDKKLEKDTRIHVATVQSMVRRILYSEGGTMPSVKEYDLIIVDEAHRGYILDKEMSDEELLYRNQLDFISKYRTVIEYFDAPRIGLTATPALHTTEIFGKPVFEYRYRRAVVEGYLVDHDAPHNLVTELRETGIVYDIGEQVPIYDPVTREITNSAELEDELRFDVEEFNSKVITESFNRENLAEIAKEINPEGPGKTLIFAVDDKHADLIVKILKEIYEPQGVSNDAIMKITGSIGDRERVLETVRRFKNNQYPSIAVTVELLTTGIDVREISVLVFLRRVKSRILFEQMLGRATRPCPEIGKTHFEVYDPVGVYESIEEVSGMKPVVQNAYTTCEDLMTQLPEMNNEKQIKNQVDLIVAKLQRKKEELNDAALEQFAQRSDGQNPKEFLQHVLSLSPEEGRKYLLEKQSLVEIIDQGPRVTARSIVVSDKQDRLLSHTRGYGKGKAPGDYLEEFREFIENNMNQITALNIVCTKPNELTRKELKELLLELDNHHFTEVQLNSALTEMSNEEITADIISIIRQVALGSPLLSHEERIKKAVSRLRKEHTFNRMQSDWLKRIEKALISERIIDKEIFETGAFKSSGGYGKIDKAFEGKLGQYLDELNVYLYEDGGEPA